MPAEKSTGAHLWIKTLSMGRSARLGVEHSVRCHSRPINDYLQPLWSGFSGDVNTHLFLCPIVLSRIDYCNSLLAGCPKQLIHKLLTVQNHAARLICRTPNSDHISPVLHILRWLPVEERIEFKLLLLAFKSVNNVGPSYLFDLLKFYIPSRQFWSSSDTLLLRIPSFRLKSFRQRKFSYQASVLWNTFPISLRHSNSALAFKLALKTHLFLVPVAFSSWHCDRCMCVGGESMCVCRWIYRWLPPPFPFCTPCA